MNSLFTLLMVKVRNALSASESLRGGFPDNVEDSIKSLTDKVHAVMAHNGLRIPYSFREIDVCSRWMRYLTASSDPESYVMSINVIADDFVKRMTELCSLFDLELDSEELWFEKEKYLYLTLLGQTIPQLKYSTNLAFTKFWGEIPPEGHVGNYLGLAMFPRRLRVRLTISSSARNRRSFKSQILVNTLFQGYKKGLLPVEPELVEKALTKHRVCLTKDPSIDFDLFDDIVEKTKIIFKDWNPLENSMTYGSDVEPEAQVWKDTNNQSSHSTLQVGFGGGGNIGYTQAVLYYNPHFNKYGKYESGKTTVQVEEFVGFASPRLRVKQRVKVPHEIDLNGPYPRNKQFVASRVSGGGTHSSIVPVYDVAPVTTSDVMRTFPQSTFRHRPEFYSPKQGNVDFGTYLEAAPACILEPMKVRMITKPSVGLHASLHKVQRSSWNHLYNHKSGFFKLIGEPLRRDHLWPFFRNWKTGSMMVSGDYSSATDLLKGDVTVAVLQGMRDKFGLIDPVLFENLKNSLTNMDIIQNETFLPKYDFECWGNFDYKTENFRQRNGQLMGHVVSFVILCVANFISYWRSREAEVGRSVSMNEMIENYPVLINGDDILFRTDSERHYDLWMAEIKKFGFEPSVGKNFCNDKFLQVNSELYRIDTVLDQASMSPKIKDLVKIPYVNFGLITNRCKKDCSKDLTVQRISLTGRDGLVAEDSMLGRLKCLPVIRGKLLNGLPDDLRSRADRLFNKHNEEMLRYFGIIRYRSHYPVSGYEEIHSSLIGNVRKYNCDKTVAFGLQSDKLDRGELEFRFERVRAMAKMYTVNPFCEMDFSSLVLGDTEEYDWVAA